MPEEPAISEQQSPPISERSNVNRRMISQRLQRLEKENSLQVLYACDPQALLLRRSQELANTQSCFIFTRSIEQYLSLFPKEELLEIIDLDPIVFNGWDLKKVLISILRGNPTALDWVRQAQNQYCQHSFAAALVNFAQENASSLRFARHHLEVLQKNRRRFEGGVGSEMLPERIISMLKPALSLRWYSQNKLQGIPPASLPELIEETFLRPVLVGEMQELLERQSNNELFELEKLPAAIADLILAELEAGPSLQTRRLSPYERDVLSQADRFFLKWAVPANA
ncbi:DNA polymerase beta superfamily protein [Polycladidibacter stylochi]|uniref:DNA polymerase beta superfamily protein n=1 Tax=Polycladidibacter stylochi TaxID=1807766 RepID=UPI00082AF82F|nr:nucleotidyltransferase domain-containing protein [Pseudovibrio stylochi]